MSRSDEAKQLGISMAVPYFQAKEMMEKNGVVTFSSNYHLYGDLSWRVMETMRDVCTVTFFRQSHLILNKHLRGIGPAPVGSW